jgi:hypothetical protein
MKLLRCSLRTGREGRVLETTVARVDDRGGNCQMKVLIQRVNRLAPGTTKNSEGREVFMTDALQLLLTACI